MSYDLVFWKQAASPLSPEAVYERLSTSDDVAGLGEVPLKAFLEKLAGVFPGAQQSGVHLDWEGESGAFQLTWSGAQITASLYGLPPRKLNMLVAVGHDLELSVYDPQRGELLESRFVPSATVTF